MDSLRVRAYNVGFGDALLITVPDRGANGDTLRHILVDVGNVQAGTGGKNEYFDPVLRSIQETLAGQPLDLYVMTHEHLDHVQGLFYGASLNPPIKLLARNVWLTASAKGAEYYKRFPEAKRRRLALVQGYLQIENFLNALNAAGKTIPLPIKSLMGNNDTRNTNKCVNYIRELASEQTTYVYRNCPLDGRHPFEEAQFKIWAPEEDVADYYGRFRPLMLDVAETVSAGAAPAPVNPEVPKGVDAESFRILLEKRRRSGYFDGLLAIDRAANNTSVVFSLKWRGWNLLFAGDAEIRSWKTMEREDQLEPVHFLKVSHHGSANGTPGEDILERILPLTVSDNRDRVAVISTFPETYHNVPDAGTTRILNKRRLMVLEINKEVRPGGYVEIEFPADGSRICVTAEA